MSCTGCPWRDVQLGGWSHSKYAAECLNLSCPNQTEALLLTRQQIGDL